MLNDSVFWCIISHWSFSRVAGFMLYVFYWANVISGICFSYFTSLFLAGFSFRTTKFCLLKPFLFSSLDFGSFMSLVRNSWSLYVKLSLASMFALGVSSALTSSSYPLNWLIYVSETSLPFLRFYLLLGEILWSRSIRWSSTSWDQNFSSSKSAFWLSFF